MVQIKRSHSPKHQNSGLRDDIQQAYLLPLQKLIILGKRKATQLPRAAFCLNSIF
jgi:hypothetical protein